MTRGGGCFFKTSVTGGGGGREQTSLEKAPDIFYDAHWFRRSAIF